MLVTSENENKRFNAFPCTAGKLHKNQNNHKHEHRNKHQNKININIKMKININIIQINIKQAILTGSVHFTVLSVGLFIFLRVLIQID